MWMGTGEGLSVYDITVDTFETFHEKNFTGTDKKVLDPDFLGSLIKKHGSQMMTKCLVTFMKWILKPGNVQPIVFKDSLNNP
jgi:hypothetical protein